MGLRVGLDLMEKEKVPYRVSNHDSSLMNPVVVVIVYRLRQLGCLSVK